MRFLLVILLCLLPFGSMAQQVVITIPCYPVERFEKLFVEKGFKLFFSGKNEHGRLTYWRNSNEGKMIVSTIIDTDGKSTVCVLDVMDDIREFGPV